MKREEAEARASRLGLPAFSKQPDPLKFDPMQEVFWDIPMSLAWKMSESVDHVRQMWNAYRAECRIWRRVGAGFSLEREEPVSMLDLPIMSTLLTDKKVLDDLGITNISLNDTNVLDYRQARGLLWKQAERGEIVATGLPSNGGHRKDIPAAAWHDLKLRQVGKALVLRLQSPPGLGYDEVLFAREEIVGSSLKLSPEYAKILAAMEAELAAGAPIAGLAPGERYQRIASRMMAQGYTKYEIPNIRHVRRFFNEGPGKTLLLTSVKADKSG